jgi:hypothetical protein
MDQATKSYQMSIAVFPDGSREALFETLKKQIATLHFILDDEGALSWEVKAIELLEAYYQSLEPTGLAWLRVPKTIWVMQKSQHRILLSEYLIAKFPSIFRTIIPTEMDPELRDELSQNKEMIEMKKNRNYAELNVGIKLRSSSHSLKTQAQISKPVLEYDEQG